MSNALLLELNKFDSQLAVVRDQNDMTLPSKRVWVRGRDWLEGVGQPARPFSVAIVGTRKPSAYGTKVVEELVRRLAVYDVCVSSGGAFGIDRIAHEEALSHGLATRAWLVGPIDDPSPRSHRQLFETIEKSARSALIVPEHLNDPESAPRLYLGGLAWLARNAWIVASADAVVIVEAHVKSGTWQTAKDGRDLGKPVFIVPGSVFTASSYGTNKMISGSYGEAVYDLGELTETLVVLAAQRSYNIRRPQE